MAFLSRCNCSGNIHRDQRVLFLIEEAGLLAYRLTGYSIVIIHTIHIAFRPDSVRSRNVLGVTGVPTPGSGVIRLGNHKVFKRLGSS